MSTSATTRATVPSSTAPASPSMNLKAMQLLREAEEAAVLVLLPQDLSGAGIEMDDRAVEEAYLRRLARHGADRMSSRRLPGCACAAFGRERVEGHVRRAGPSGEERARDERLQLGPEDQDRRRDGEHHEHDPRR
jgi:hypothetical protein